MTLAGKFFAVKTNGDRNPNGSNIEATIFGIVLFCYFFRVWFNDLLFCYFFRVWSNDLWFVFHDSSWSFHEPYFSRKHIFYESYRVNRTEDYGLKICKYESNYSANVIILKTSLFMISSINHFFIKQKFCGHQFLPSQNNRLQLWEN